MDSGLSHSVQTSWEAALHGEGCAQAGGDRELPVSGPPASAVSSWDDHVKRHGQKQTRWTRSP